MSQQNWIDPSLSEEIRKKAEKILSELNLTGLRIRFNKEKQELTFTQDRRVVEVPLPLIDEERWIDIRFLFRAILSSSPSQWNLTADTNDWTYTKQVQGSKPQ